MRRLAIVALGTAVLAGVMAPAGAAPAGPGEYPGVRNILPPGQSGSINAVEAAQVAAGDPQGRVAVDGQNAPPNFANQLEMYDALNHADLDGLTDGQLSAYYKDAPLTLSDRDAVRTDRPKSGVVIRWDSFGVPYIEGRTREDAAFGSGYAGTKDRMFLMDLLRHVGAARAAEFLGPDEANVAMDQEQLRAAFYTPEEAAAQIDQAAERFGAEGRRLVAALDAYIAGINAAQQEMCPGRRDRSGLPGRVRRAAEEARALDPRRRRLRRLAGRRHLRQGRRRPSSRTPGGCSSSRRSSAPTRRSGSSTTSPSPTTPRRPTTASSPAPYGGGPVDPTQPGVALPDLDGPTAPGTGADAGSGGLPDPGLGSLQGRFGTQERATVVHGPFGPIDLGGVPDMMSNAALVAGDRTADGHPRVVFGPQTGYFTPQLLTEQAVVAPGIRARGVSFAGTSLVVQLGRGVDYAWSATSAGSDLVDTVVERLCDPDGGTATVESTGYLVGGECRPMDRRCTRRPAMPNAAAPGLPQTYRFLVLRTEHGIVQLRTTVDGQPVAVVAPAQHVRPGAGLRARVRAARQPRLREGRRRASATRRRPSTTRSTGSTSTTATSRTTRRAACRCARTASTGTCRAGATRPTTGRAGWPSATTRSRSTRRRATWCRWNNKQAPGFSAADDQWGYGPVHRSEAISDRLAELRRAGGVTTTDVVAAVQDAATVDSRAVYTLPSLLDVIGDDPAGSPTRWRCCAAGRSAAPTGWTRTGTARTRSRRRSRSSTSGGRGVDDHGVAQDLLSGTLGDLVGELPQRLDDHPRQGLGSSWNGVAWYGYVLRTSTSSGAPTRGAWSQAYCGGGDLAACQSELRASLRCRGGPRARRAGRLVGGELTYDKHIDDIRATTAGLVAVRPIDWQNRPTFQQVVNYQSHRAGRRVTALRGSCRGVGPAPRVERRLGSSQRADGPLARSDVPGTTMNTCSPLVPDVPTRGPRPSRPRWPPRWPAPSTSPRSRPGPTPPRVRRRPRRPAPPSPPARPARPSSTSPRPPSRPRCSTAPSRCRSCSTSGPSGAARASSSPRCSSGWPPRAAAPGCWRRSTSTPTRRSPRACASRASPR